MAGDVELVANPRQLSAIRIHYAGIKDYTTSEVEELLAERGLRAEHVTVWTGVQRYGQEME